MANDDKIKVEVTAENAGLKTGMSGASDAVQTALKEMESTFKNAESAMSGSILNITNKLMSIGPAVAAAAAAFTAFEFAKATFDSFLSYAGQVRTLSNTLGISADEASRLNISLRILGVESEAYISTMLKMDRQLKKNEETFTQLGIKVRDEGTKAFLPQTEILDNVIEKMKEYKPGADQMMFAMDVLGPRGADLAFKFMRLKEAQEMAKGTMEALGFKMSQDLVGAAKKYEMQMNTLSVMWDMAKVQIGSELLPQFAGLAAAMSQVAGPVITGLIVAFKALLSAFTVVASAIVEAGLSIAGVFMAIGDSVSATLEALTLAAQGKFSEAWGTIRRGGKAAYEDLQIAGTMMVNEARKTADEITNLWRGDLLDEKGGKKAGTKTYTPTDKKEKSRMPDWEAELKKREAEENAFYGFSIAKQQEYWQDIVDRERLTAEERRAIMNKLYDLMVKASRESFEAEQKNVKDQAAALDKLNDDRAKALQTELKLNDEAIKGKEQELEAQLKLGKINTTEQIKALKEVEKERYKIEHDLLLDEAQVYGEGSEKFVEAQNKMLLAKQKHSTKMKELDKQDITEQRRKWDQIISPIENAFSTSIKGIIQGTQTLKGAIANLAQSIVLSFIDMGIKIAADWAKTQILMLITGKAAQTTAAVSQVASNAAVAAAATYASISAIPIIGPFMAPGMAAEAYTATMAFAPLAAAARGYDVPPGINPVTQLHQEEMVLPADIAGGMRDLIRGGGSGGRDVRLTINAIDDQGVARAARNSRSPLGKVLRQLVRDRHFK